MLNSFFKINMPYGIAKNSKGQWMAFNREYRPLGFTTKFAQQDVNRGYEELPVKEFYLNLKEADLEYLANLGSKHNTRKDEKGKVCTVWFYDDDTNPDRRNIQKRWDDYFKIIQYLSSFTNNRDEVSKSNKYKSAVKRRFK